MRGSRRRALKYNAARLDETFPYVARTDDVLSGAIRRVMTEAAALPPCLEVEEPAVSCVSIADALASGHPEHLEPYWQGGKRYEGAIAFALAGIAEKWKVHGEKVAAEPARCQANAPAAPGVDWRAKARASVLAERRERERLGIGLSDDLTTEQMLRISSARNRAIAELLKATDDCPF